MASDDAIRHQAEGKMDQVKGKVQEFIGEMSENRETALKGKGEQIKGKFKEGLGKVEEEVNRDTYRNP